VSRVTLLAQSYYGRAPSASFRRGIAKTFDKCSPGQDRSYNLALHADSSPVDDPQSFKAKPARLFQVFFNDRPDIPGRYTVQVEYIRDRNPNRLFLLLHCC